MDNLNDEIINAFGKHGYDRDWLANPDNSNRIEVVESYNKLTRTYMYSYYVDYTLLFTAITEMINGVMEQTRILDWKEQRPDRLPRSESPQYMRDMGVDLNIIDVSKELKMLGLED